MVAVRWALYLAFAALAGWCWFGQGGRVALAAAIAAALLSVVWLVLVAGQMAGVAAWPPDLATVRLLLGETALGRAWIVRMVALALAAVALVVPAFGRRAAAAAACVGVATLAWSGHGAAGDGAPGWWHLAADIAHLVAASLWVGALLVLLAAVARPAAQADARHLRSTHDALRGFAGIGTALVATLAGTGLASAWWLVGPVDLSALVSTPYGQLLLGKLALFAAMLALAALNRWRLTPALADALASGEPSHARRALRRSLAAETGSAVAVLGLVAWLGTLPPPGVDG